jgi:ribosomal-protein-alanine N-acetyltransferase
VTIETITNSLVSAIIGPLEIKYASKPYVLRRMSLMDLDRVYAMEKDIFPTPWPQRAFKEEMLNESFSIPLVVEHLGKVVGYSVSWIVVDELHIGNVAIVPEHRRRGVSETMLMKLLRMAAKAGLRVAHLEVRRSNHSAIALYQKLGFEVVGIRKGYYDNNKEDALLMTRELSSRVMKLVNST